MCVTVRLGNSGFRVPQALFAAIVAILAYLSLMGFATIVTIVTRGSVTKAPVTTLDCGSACCRIVTACDLHLRLEPLTSRRLTRPADQTPSASLYSVLQVSHSIPGADLRDAARETVGRVRDGGFSDTEVDSMVSAVYRTAQFLEHGPSRQAYNDFVMRALPDEHAPRDPVTNRLTLICSAARDQCCETAEHGS